METTSDPGTALANHVQRWLTSLRGRLALIMALAIAPALALALLQAKWAYDRERDTIMAQLGQIALSAAETHKEVFLGAKNMISLLASQPEVINPNEECRVSLRTALLSARDYANIARVDASGRMSCTALPGWTVMSQDVSAWVGQLHDTKELVISPVLDNVPSIGPSLIAGQAFFDANNIYQGALLVVIRLSVLERLPLSSGVPSGAAIGLVAADGVPILGGGALNAPAHIIADAISRQHLQFTWSEPDGKVTLYALAPLLEQRIFVAIAAEQESLVAWTQLDLMGRIIFPVVMLALALVIVALGGHYLVLRWLNYLRRLAQAYSRGAFRVDTSAALTAPTEFQEVVQTLSQMAVRIDRRERDLTLAIEQRDAMLREIHHRVKNNLQIVTSLLSIEAGRANGHGASPHDALIRARARVIAFAQIHQWLYEKENFAAVGLASFLRDYCAFVHETFGGEDRNVELEIHAPEIELSLDTAVPLALFILEGQSDAYLHAFVADLGGKIAITVEELTNDDYILRIEESGHVEQHDGRDHATSLSLMRGFARQIGGTFELHRHAAGGAVMELTFHAPPPQSLRPPPNEPR